MIKIGEHHTVTVIEKHENGGFQLAHEEGDTVWMPERLAPEELEEGDSITVFVYKDKEERRTATILKPKITLGEIALLEVKSTNDYGAFLEWGMDKDLFVPHKEQSGEMIEGQAYLVYMYVDEVTDRLAASAKLDHVLSNKEIDLERKEEVDIIIWDATDLGYKVIINNKHLGLIYYNEIFTNVRYGDKRKGYIKEVREDNKIDVSLHKIGYDKVEPNADKIMDRLQQLGGFLDLHDKSDPDEIRNRLSMSKKTYKKSIGLLYKKDYITIKDDGIYLVEE